MTQPVSIYNNRTQPRQKPGYRGLATTYAASETYDLNLLLSNQSNY